MSLSHVLVLAEHHKNRLTPSVYRTVTAALEIGANVDIVVLGASLETLAREAAAIEGVQRVLCVDAPHLSSCIAENWSQEIVRLAESIPFTHLLAPANAFGKNILPRVAALLDIAQVSEVLAIESSDRFVRPIYAGNVWSTVHSVQLRHALTIRTTCFEPAASSSTASAEIVPIIPSSAPFTTTVVGQQLNEGGRPELTSARVVVSGGIALGSVENFKLIEALADKLGAAVGASRAAVDAGFISNDCQVGQTGKVVAPDLYIAVGISGQVQHLSGMKGSKVIVAINKDPQAPIFDVADYGMVGDLFEILPELTAQI
jgi:electron transfer flavoprotein alpha subunit